MLLPICLLSSLATPAPLLRIYRPFWNQVSCLNDCCFKERNRSCVFLTINSPWIYQKHDYSLNLVFAPRGLFILIGNLTNIGDVCVVLYLFCIIHHDDDHVFHTFFCLLFAPHDSCVPEASNPTVSIIFHMMQLAVKLTMKRWSSCCPN